MTQDQNRDISLMDLRKAHEEKRLDDIDGEVGLWTRRVMAEVRQVALEQEQESVGTLWWKMAPVSLALLLLCGVLAYRFDPVGQLELALLMIDLSSLTSLGTSLPL